MRCMICGKNLDGAGPNCSECDGKESEIKVLSPDERDNFHGLTILQGNDREPGPDYPQWPADGNREYSSPDSINRAYIRQDSLGTKPKSYAMKLSLAVAVLVLSFLSLRLALIIIVFSSIARWLFRRFKI